MSGFVLETLARQSLYAAVVFLAVAGPCRLLSRRSPGLSRALWTLVLLRLVLPTDLAFTYSLRSLAESSALWRWLESRWPAGGAPDGSATLTATSEALAEAAAGPTSAQAASLGTADFLVAAWLAGVVLGFLGWHRRRRAYRAVVLTASPLRDGRLLAAAERWRRRLGLRRPVALVSSAARVAPFTLGLLRPAVFLPREIVEAADRRLAEAALAHELAHVRRVDDLWLRCEQWLRIVFFFHPAVWIATARINDERERLCDRRVLAEGDLDPRAYGRGLLAALRMGLGGVEAAPALASRKRRLDMRLDDILSSRRRRRPAHPWLGWAVALAAAILVLPLAGEAVAGAAASGEMGRGTEPAMAHPLPEGRVTSPFGPRPDPLGRDRRHHDGIDLVAPVGTPILASADGLVKVAGDGDAAWAGHGRVVVIDHGGGLESAYSHLGSVAVAVGDRVAAGQQVGSLGNSGLGTGPHLHFELRRDGEPVDPAPYVAAP